MPSTVNNLEIKLKQLIPPRPQATRGKPFPLNGSEEWFVYPHGKNVYLYNFKDKSLSKEYREHAYPVGVSKLSPSGSFVASGDQCGNLRVWSVERIETKLELRVIGGKINDLEWSEDEKYIAICGEGRDKFANVIKVDGGASFGELIGPSKSCPSVTLNSSLLLLASDDKSVTVYRATPTFKFVRTLRDHENFVHVVKIRGDGKVFASAGADGKVFIYSSEAEMINQIKAHDMSILSMEWIDDSTLLTASSDKSLKLWSVPEGNLLCQSEVSDDWTFEKQICGIKVIGRNVLVLRLEGSLELRDKKSLKLAEDEDKRLLTGIGHSKGIVDIIQSEKDTLNSVSYDGNLKKWKFWDDDGLLTCQNDFKFSCKNVQKLKNENSVVSENKIIFGNGKILEYEEKIVGYESDEDEVIIENGSVITKGVKKLLISSKIELACFKKEKDLLCIYTEDLTLKFYNNSKRLTFSIDIPTKITSMAFNPSGTALATADDQRRIKVYKRNQSDWIKESCQWCNHSARIDSLIWLDDELILSSGVDGHILAWSLEVNKIGPVQEVKAAHSSPVNKLTKFGEEGMFVSVAGDSCIKLWKISKSEC